VTDRLWPKATTQAHHATCARMPPTASPRKELAPEHNFLFTSPNSKRPLTDKVRWRWLGVKLVASRCQRACPMLACNYHFCELPCNYPFARFAPRMLRAHSSTQLLSSMFGEFKAVEQALDSLWRNCHPAQCPSCVQQLSPRHTRSPAVGIVHGRTGRATTPQMVRTNFVTECRWVRALLLGAIDEAHGRPKRLNNYVKWF
jgi:hypothetical protein